MFIRQSLKVFGLTAGGMLSILVLFEYFDVSRSVGTESPPALLMLEYLALTVPKYLIYALPLAVLVSTLVVLGMSSKNLELVAIRAIGGSLRRAAWIFVLSGILWSGASFLLSEMIAPASTRRATDILDVDIRKEARKMAFAEGRLWMRLEEGAIFKAEAFSETRMKGISVIYMGNGIERRIEAKEAGWNGSSWVLEEVRKYEFRDGAMLSSRLDEMLFSGLDKPDTLAREKRDPEEMTYGELRAYVRQLQRAGFRADRYLVNLYGKFSYPLICLAMALLGSALAIRQRSGGIMKAVGYSVGVLVAYWALHMLLLSLGYSSRIPPLAAAWGAPVAFLILGGFLFARSEG